MNKAIIGLFAALALAGCATTPSTTSRSAAKPAAKPAAPAETGIQGKQAWNGLIVVVPRGIFSCDAAVRKVARTYKLFQETREYNNDGNGFSYEYSDTYDTPLCHPDQGIEREDRTPGSRRACVGEQQETFGQTDAGDSR